MTLGRRSLAAALFCSLVPLSGSCVVVGSTSPPSAEPTHSTTAPAMPADRATTAERDMAEAIFDRVDAEREARGLSPLAWDEALAAVARRWNAEMAQRGRLEHQDIGSLLRQRSLRHLAGIGENIFRSTGPVPAGTIHAGWMRSDDHRANVLQPGWDRVGIAVLCAEDGSVWATQEFGRTAGADLPPATHEIPPAQPVVRPEHDGPRCG